MMALFYVSFKQSHDSDSTQNQDPETQTTMEFSHIYTCADPSSACYSLSQNWGRNTKWQQFLHGCQQPQSQGANYRRARENLAPLKNT